MSITSCLMVAVLVGAPVAPDKKPVTDASRIADKLIDRVDLKDGFRDATFGEVLDFFRESLGVNVVVDPSWNKNRQEQSGSKVEAERIEIPRLNSVRYDTVLKLTLAHVDGDYVIKADHILLVSKIHKADLIQASATAPLLGSTPDAPPMDQAPDTTTVTLTATEKPLKEVLNMLLTRGNANVVLSGDIAKSGEKPITLQLNNVTVDSAAAAIAEAAGLRAMKNGNVIYLVSIERYEAQLKKTAPQNMGFGFGLYSLEDIETLGRLFGKKGDDVDSQRTELNRLKKELGNTIEERNRLFQRLEKLEADLQAIRPKKN
jgi:hypothetical protein